MRCTSSHFEGLVKKAISETQLLSFSSADSAISNQFRAHWTIYFLPYFGSLIISISSHGPPPALRASSRLKNYTFRKDDSFLHRYFTFYVVFFGGKSDLLICKYRLSVEEAARKENIRNLTRRERGESFKLDRVCVPCSDVIASAQRESGSGAHTHPSSGGAENVREITIH